MSDIEFLNKLNDNMDLDEDSQDFDVESENEEELDFDLDELISKIDAKMEELNNEDNDETKIIDIENNDVKETINKIDKDFNNAMKDSEQLEIKKLISNIDKNFMETINKTNASITSDISRNEDDIVNDVKSKNGNLNENEESEIRKLIRSIDKNVIETMNQNPCQETKEDLEISDIIKRKKKKMDELNLNNSDIKDDVKEELDIVSGDNVIDKNDINNIIDKVSSNVKEASNIFLKNIEMKKKLDSRFEELKKLQKEIETAKNNNYQEINDYKDSVLNELNKKKNEIENRLNELKDLQSKFEKEKREFEIYKIDSKKEIEEQAKKQKVQDESRKEELENLEDKLRRQKDSLDEEKRQLSLDRIQYEADKNELANNMLKFNEIVGTFTDGVGNLN